jgi:uncharacterized protein YbjQ (UPF0145 family)
MRILYNIIFSGKTVPGKNLSEIRERLMELLKTNEKGIDRFFSGKPIVIRENLDFENAERVKLTFEKAGAICTLEPVNVSNEKTPPQLLVAQRYVKTAEGKSMIITNIETVPGKTIIDHFGLVSGSTIRAKHIGKDLLASLKNLVGGELKGYTELLQESRQQAMDRMIHHASQLGANAIINVRFSTSSVAQGAAELYVYGTAVRVK